MSDVWLFTYGGLMWNPFFEFKESVRARVEGLHRSFCIQAQTWRGTAEKPGLVLGLEPGGSCEGIAFRLPDSKTEDVLRGIDERELIRDVYHRLTVPATLSDGRKVDALTYVANLESRERRQFSLSEKAEMIQQAVGKSGPCRDYVIFTAKKLQELGISDGEVEQMASLIEPHF